MENILHQPLVGQVKSTILHTFFILSLILLLLTSPLYYSLGSTSYLF
nr:MAG TPA: hypothetical protein [Caudoviricetes sp.]